MKYTIALGIAAAAAAALWADANAAVAEADTHILVGGDGDCDSSIFVNAKKAAGEWDSTANNIAIKYPTCVSGPIPFLSVGGTPDNQKISEAADATRQAWDANCVNTSEKCALEGLSLGSAAVSIVGNDVDADTLGSNTHVITYASPWGTPGILGPNPGQIGDIWKMVVPILSQTPTSEPRVAGSENRVSINDFVSNGAQQSTEGSVVMMATLLGFPPYPLPQIIPPGHAYPAGTPLSTFVTKDGVTQEVYDAPPFGPLPGVVNPANNPAIK